MRVEGVQKLGSPSRRGAGTTRRDRGSARDRVGRAGVVSGAWEALGIEAEDELGLDGFLPAGCLGEADTRT